MEKLSDLDQLPFFWTYSEMVLCFPLPADAHRSDVTANLARGVQVIKKHFPSLASQVVFEKDKINLETTSDKVLLKPYDEEPMLRVKDLSESVPPYNQIKEAKAPAAMLDGSILCPMKAIPERYDGSTTTPTLIIQANFVTGGLILCFAAMHSFMDASGLGQVIRLFARACNGQELPNAAIEAGTLNRGTIPPPLPSDQPPLEHQELRRFPGENTEPPTASAIPTPWAYFRLPNTVLSKLKAEVTKHCSAEMGVTWVSTNDVACALIWRAVLAARSAHLEEDIEVNLLRAVNGRRILRPPVPEGYFGNIVVGAATTFPRKDLVGKLSIETITIAIRKSLQAVTDFHVRSVATLIRSTADKNTITFEPPNPAGDLVISSWAALPIYPSDFGPLLGKPEFVRRPHFTPCDGLVYIMPTSPDGHLDVALSLREDDLERLKADRVWMSFAEWIG